MRTRAAVVVLAGAALLLGAWAWAQHEAAAQQPMGPAGQGMMGPGSGMGGQGFPGSPGVSPGAMGPQGGQPIGPRGAQGPRGYGMGGWQGGAETPLFERPLISEMLAMKSQLGLTAQQVQRLETLRAEYEKGAIRRTGELRIAEIDLSQLLTLSAPDMAAVEAQVRKIAALEGDLRLARIKTLEAGKAVLSQEQWQRFESMAPPHGSFGPYGGPSPHGQFGPGASGPYGGMMGGYGPGYGYGPGGMMGGYGP